MEINKLIGIIFFVTVGVILIILVILMAIQIYKIQFSSDNITINDTHISYNGHPISNKEANRLGNISIDELNKIYPPNYSN